MSGDKHEIYAAAKYPLLIEWKKKIMAQNQEARITHNMCSGW